jgi:hypothetical protein
LGEEEIDRRALCADEWWVRFGKWKIANLLEYPFEI